MKNLESLAIIITLITISNQQSHPRFHERRTQLEKKSNLEKKKKIQKLSREILD